MSSRPISVMFSALLAETARVLELDFRRGVLGGDGASDIRSYLPTWQGTLSGDIGFAHIELDVHATRHRAEFRYGVSFADLNMGLQIKRKSTVDMLLGWLSRSDRPALPESLAGLVTVRARRPEGLHVGAGLEEALLDLCARLPDFRVTDTTIDASERRPRTALPDAGEIAATIRTCVEVAEKLTLA
jgi:hypothetical protein